MDTVKFKKFTDTHKWCWCCKAMVLHVDFVKNKSNKDGLASLCKKCKREKDKLRDRTRATTGLPPQSEETRIRKKVYRQNLRKKVIAHLGGRCSNPDCMVVNLDGTRGCSDERCLQIDHVNGGGRQEYLALNHASTLYNKVLKDTTGSYQLLCANCNWIKRYINKEAPQ